jgi:S1-C subfamily serine protease
MLIEILRFAVASAVVLCLYVLPAGVAALFERPEPSAVPDAAPDREAVYSVALPSPIPEARAAAVEAQAAPVRTTTARITSTQRTTAIQGATRSHSRGSRTTCMASTGEVQALGGGTYQVQRSMLDRYLRDEDAAASLGSAAWHKNHGGAVDGIRVLRVRCGSPLADAGLMKGDVVRSANGHALDSMAGMLALWWQLRTKDEVVLEVTHGGARRTMTYRLV